MKWSVVEDWITHMTNVGKQESGKMDATSVSSEILHARVQRMLREAEKRITDAGILSTSPATAMSDSAYLLELLAFEILLKANLLMHGRSARNHSYPELFAALPRESQKEILKFARERMGPHADYSRPKTLLASYAANFVALRYPYEEYEGMTEDEYREVGDRWIQAGSPLNGATFRYYPEELTGLIDALKAEILDWLSGNRPGTSP